MINFSHDSPGTSYPALENALDVAEQHDVLVVVSAGNDGADAEQYIPSFDPYVLSVTGITLDNGTEVMWSGSNYLSSDPAFIAAPAEDVVGPEHGGGDDLEVRTGTSYAAPFVSGAAALLLRLDGSLSREQLETTLICTGELMEVDVPNVGYQDWSRLDVLQAVREVLGELPPAASLSEPNDYEEIVGESIELAWEPAAGLPEDSFFYRVYLDDVYQGYVGPDEDTSFQIGGLVPDTQYTWRVDTYWWSFGPATNADPWLAGCGSTPTESITFTFTVLDELDIDDDGDGQTENEGDCDDSDPDRFEGNTEICEDGIDQDCDEADDECPPEWQRETVVASGSVGYYCAIELDSSDDPHIAYRNGVWEVWYAAMGLYGWSMEVVDSSGSGYPEDLDLDLEHDATS